jgi:phosphoglycolate phosphatase
MKLIIFDLDGTIEDSRLDMSLSVNRVRKLYQLPELPIDAVQSLVNKGMDFLYRNCFPELVQQEIPKDLIFKYEMDYGQHIVDHTKIYDGMDDVIKSLSKHHRLFVYTNKPEKLSILLLDKLGLLSYFSRVIGGDSFKESKPSPEPIRQVIKELEINPEEIYVLGDTEVDIMTAKNLNAYAIWCKWGYSKNTPSITPDYIAMRPVDLLKIIL